MRQTGIKYTCDRCGLEYFVDYASKRSNMSAEELNWDNLGPDGGPYPYKPYDSFDEFMAETRHQPGYIRTMLYKAYLTGYQDGIAYGREHPLP